MLKRLESTLKYDCRLEPGRLDPGPVVAGVSGGPDSLCLLHALVQLRVPVVAAHLDHGLRPESSAEAEIVRQTGQQLGVQVIVERQDVAALAQTAGQSIEEAARNVRYGFLFRLAAEYNAAAVAVGHNADDQAETVLMHLLRGAGPAGLGGMAFRSLPNPWSTTIPLIRPLLGVWRGEIMAYAAENNLQPLTDTSNADPRFYRNRLRHEALPYLETLNPGVRTRLWQTAELLRDEGAVVAAAAEAAWQVCRLQDAPGFVALHAGALQTQLPAIQRRVVRRAIARLRPGLRDIDYAAVERALAFIHAPSRSGETDLIAGLRLEADGERVWLAEQQAVLPDTHWPQMPAGAVWELDVPGDVRLSANWRLSAALHTCTPDTYTQAVNNTDPFQAWLDFNTLALPLNVRTRRPGDRLRPLGMSGHSLKLSDFMTNSGMPRRARDAWPLVISGEEIAWVPGYRIGEAFAVREETRKTVRLACTPPAR